MVNNKDFFGNTMEFVIVLEIQRGGLPHAYCIIILYRQSRQILNIPNNIDGIISTGVHGDDYPQLREIILKHNVHTPSRGIHPDVMCVKPLCA